MANRLTPKIAPLEADPEFAAASRVLRVLTDGLQEIERSIDLLSVEDYLAQRPADQRAKTALNRLQKKPKPSAGGSAPDRSTVPPDVAAALAIITGERAPRPMGRRARIVALREDREPVRAAIMTQTAIVDGIRDARSAELAKGLRTGHDEIAREFYRAMQALAAATEKEAALRADVQAKGYQFRDDLLPTPSLRAAIVAGVESNSDSEVSRVRRQLEGWKIL